MDVPGRTYIIHRDEIGLQFAEALAAKARQGVQVRLQSLLGQRDQLITLLARSDPASADRLADTYMSYRQATGTVPQPGEDR